MSETKKCLDCGKEKPLESFRLAYRGLPKLNRPEYGELNPERVRQNRCMACYGARERAKMKLDYLHALGSKCSCCGESDQRFLTLDHVRNDGNKHREEFNCQQIMRQARKEGYPTDKYQVLCFNCNCGKSANGGICPHRDGISKEESYRRLKDRETYIGRDHVPINSGNFSDGFDSRRMQLNRRVLKPCPYCGKEFGTNEMTRHKRADHSQEMKSKREEVLKRGRFKNGVQQGYNQFWTKVVGPDWKEILS